MGFGRIQVLSPEFAEFLTFDPPFGSVRVCTIYIGMYRFLSERLGIKEPSRLAALFKDHPEMITAFPNIAFGDKLWQYGFITKTLVKDEWDDSRFVQIEALLEDCRALTRGERDDLDVIVKRWKDLNLTPFDV